MNTVLDEVLIGNLLEDMRSGDLPVAFVESVADHNPSYWEAIRRFKEEKKNE